MTPRAGGPGPWARELLSRPRPQPDRRSCGASVLVVAEACADEAYARRLVSGRLDFGAEVLAAHRRATRAVDGEGRPQVPWPRALGTPPWAVARRLTASAGTAVRPVAIWPWRRARAERRLRDAVASGPPAALYVGSRLLPRHVLLVLDAGPGPEDPLSVYDPATGTTRRVMPRELRSGRLRAGWPVPWFALLPATGRVSPARPRARRTRA